MAAEDIVGFGKAMKGLNAPLTGELPIGKLLGKWVANLAVLTRPRKMAMAWSVAEEE